MEIIRLPVGEAAPADADCICIDHHGGGMFNLLGTALCGDVSVALTGEQHASMEAAEEQGIAWAQAQGVKILYVATDAPMAGD